MNQEATKPSPTARSRLLGRRGAGHTQRSVGHRPQARGWDLLPAAIAEPIASLGDLGERPFGVLECRLERAPHANLRQSADRLDGPVTYTLSKALSSPALGPRSETRYALTHTVPALRQRLAHYIEVGLIGWHVPLKYPPVSRLSASRAVDMRRLQP
jgi:hypothetical protein